MSVLKLVANRGNAWFLCHLQFIRANQATITPAKCLCIASHPTLIPSPSFANETNGEVVVTEKSDIHGVINLPSTHR